MEHQQRELRESADLQQTLIAQEKQRSVYRPLALDLTQASNKLKESPQPDRTVSQKEDATPEHPSKSLPSPSAAIWIPEHAALEGEFTALKTILSTYLDLQRRIFRDLGSDEASPIDAGSARSECGRDRAVVLSDAISYIEYLEDLQKHLVDEKSALEAEVSGWEWKSPEDRGRARA
jgi:hypothetical protein